MPLWCLAHCGPAEHTTWTDIEFEVLSDGADGGEVSGVVEMFLHRLRCNLTKLIFHSFPHADCIHGDACARAQGQGDGNDGTLTG